LITVWRLSGHARVVVVGAHRQGRGLGQGFFGDFHGREIAAGVQAPEISDDWETERAYLNMEAR